jgi:hypothetical protein
MMIERINPDEPSRAPAVIKSLLSRTKPIATAESPAYEFKRDITVGMSDPQIGIINNIPNRSERKIIIGKKDLNSAGFRISRTPKITAILRSARLIKF